MKYAAILLLVISVAYGQTIQVRSMSVNHSIDQWWGEGNFSPQELAKIKHKDTVFVIVHDTVHIHDTVRVRAWELNTDTFRVISADTTKNGSRSIFMGANTPYESGVVTGEQIGVDTIGWYDDPVVKKGHKAAKKVKFKNVAKKKLHRTNNKLFTDRYTKVQCNADTVKGTILYNIGHKEFPYDQGNRIMKGYWIGCNGFSSGIYTDSLMWIPAYFKHVETKSNKYVLEILPYGDFQTQDFESLRRYRVYGMIADSMKLAGMEKFGFFKVRVTQYGVGLQ